MSTEDMKVTVPLTILTFVIMIMISIIGWIINDKLTNIYDNITGLKTEIKTLTDNRYNHETRLQLLEQKMEKINSQK